MLAADDTEISTVCNRPATRSTMTGAEPDDLTLQAAGPSMRGGMHDGVGRHVGPGDVIIVPINLPHRFSKLDSTITYIVTRIEVPGTGK